MSVKHENYEHLANIVAPAAPIIIDVIQDSLNSFAKQPKYGQTLHNFRDLPSNICRILPGYYNELRSIVDLRLLGCYFAELSQLSQIPNRSIEAQRHNFRHLDDYQLFNLLIEQVTSGINTSFDITAGTARSYLLLGGEINSIQENSQNLARRVAASHVLGMTCLANAVSYDSINSDFVNKIAQNEPIHFILPYDKDEEKFLSIPIVKESRFNLADIFTERVTASLMDINSIMSTNSNNPKVGCPMRYITTGLRYGTTNMINEALYMIQTPLAMAIDTEINGFF